MRQFTPWPHCRMRALALRVDAGSCVPLIRAVGRSDVVSHPLLGCAGSKPLSALYDPRNPAAKPFTGTRLVRAVRAPAPPDMVVFAHSEARSAIPDDVVRGMPCILVLPAAARLSPNVPRELSDAGEPAGADAMDPAVIKHAIEREVMLIVTALLALLGSASPDELAWLSRTEAS